MNDIVARPKRVPPAAPAPPQTAPRFYAQPSPSQRRSWRLPQWAQGLLFIPLIMFGSLFIQSAVLGQIAVGVYGIVALIWRVPSRTTFTLALLSMLATTALLVGKGDVLLAQNFAVYTFLLLVVGVITLGRELKQEGGRVYVRRHK